MISGIRGRIAGKQPGAIFVDLHGLTLRVLTSQTTVGDAGENGEPIELVTHLYVREDQLTLFGFSTAEELQLFELLNTVTGIGPRVALSVLSSGRPDEIHRAIANEDVAMLSRVPGIGKKTANRIIFDLRGKLPESVVVGMQLGSKDREALEALQALGYSLAESHEALSQVGHAEGQTVEERVFAALQSLARA